MINRHKRMLPDPRIKPTTVRTPGGHASDQAIVSCCDQQEEAAKFRFWLPKECPTKAQPTGWKRKLICTGHSIVCYLDLSPQTNTDFAGLS